MLSKPSEQFNYKEINSYRERQMVIQSDETGDAFREVKEQRSRVAMRNKNTINSTFRSEIQGKKTPK